MVTDFIKAQFIRGDKTFTLSNVKTTANEAKLHCSSINGKLAEITDETQHDFRSKLLEEYINKTSKFFKSNFFTTYFDLDLYKIFSNLKLRILLTVKFFDWNVFI